LKTAGNVVGNVRSNINIFLVVISTTKRREEEKKKKKKKSRWQQR